MKACKVPESHPHWCGCNGPIHCERCGEKLNPRTLVWLECDQETTLYHDPEKGIPEGHTSQGAFTFGAACARAVLKAGGRNIRPKARN